MISREYYVDYAHQNLLFVNQINRSYVAEGESSVFRSMDEGTLLLSSDVNRSIFYAFF